MMSTLDGVSLWDREGRHLVSEMEEDRSGIYSARWLAQGDAIITTHPGGKVKVWDRGGALRAAARRFGIRRRQVFDLVASQGQKNDAD